MKLSELINGESGVIVKVNGEGNFRKRIIEMGFIKGQRVTVVKNAPLSDPIEYMVMGYEISLRRTEADLVEVEMNYVPSKEINHIPIEKTSHKVSEEQSNRGNKKQISVALVGNPNCGKTTLFNFVSGLHEHVGNYSGVTIDAKSAKVNYKDYEMLFTDLPGAYSLSEYSPEEIFVREHIVNNKPDIIVNVVDTTNLERNLFLTTQLIDLETNIIVSLNMFDEFQNSGDTLDVATLGELFNMPFIPTVAKRQRGIVKLMDEIIERYNQSGSEFSSITINYGLENESYIKKIEESIHGKNNSSYPDRFLAIKLLEGDKQFAKVIDDSSVKELVAEKQQAIKGNTGDGAETILTDARYGFISGALQETLTKSSVERKNITRAIDAVITNRHLGFPIFFGIMWLMFWCTFTLGEYPTMVIDYLVNALQSFSEYILPSGAINDLITHGIIGGVGSVIGFLPNILLLFLFISILEDTGYMSRAAFITDKLMHKIGLHGKSFIPLIIGFGCTVPAIMATRIVENKENRILTMLIAPFMSCSAKLPVYILILGTFFPENAANMLFLIHFIGVLIAAGTAILLSKFVFKSKDKPFVMELPPYRMPYARSSFRHMWEKGSQYLRKMGGIILVSAVVIWALSYYPQNSETINQQADIQLANVENVYLSMTTNGVDSLVAAEQRDSTISSINMYYTNLQLDNSFLARIGKGIEPVVEPLGFDWKMGVCLTAGIAAKEIIVSTMGIINQFDTEDEEGMNNLQKSLLNERHTHGEKIGEKVYNKAVGLSFLMFTLVYFPCFAAVSAIHRESGHIKWMWVTVGYTTGLAWILSYIVYNIAKLFI